MIDVADVASSSWSSNVHFLDSARRRLGSLLLRRVSRSAPDVRHAERQSSNSDLLSSGRMTWMDLP